MEINFIGTLMNKSLGTNVLALTAVLLGIGLHIDVLYSIGLFSLAGAVTNWLAIHMLFEKVPGLYGSGVIPARFEEFKSGIKAMIMEQFFNAKNIEKFIESEAQGLEVNLEAVIQKVDFTPTFESLIEVIQQSSFGPMLEMVGGVTAIEPMREPFVIKIKQSIIETSQTDDFKELLFNEFGHGANVGPIINKVESILEQRLAELTPSLVKDIIKKMIRKHLGWLVVWGGVFGGLIGAIASIWGAI
ncbi:MAG: uncharacterized membrane protein YheB (UPF0754 family) [Oceanospirillaceae bacterium]|jgi:uncharacterized membrane protein YheB (UPF0754 family)